MSDDPLTKLAVKLLIKEGKQFARERSLKQSGPLKANKQFLTRTLERNERINRRIDRRFKPKSRSRAREISFRHEDFEQKVEARQKFETKHKFETIRRVETIHKVEVRRKIETQTTEVSFGSQRKSESRKINKSLTMSFEHRISNEQQSTVMNVKAEEQMFGSKLYKHFKTKPIINVKLRQPVTKLSQDSKVSFKISPMNKINAKMKGLMETQSADSSNKNEADDDIIVID